MILDGRKTIEVRVAYPRFTEMAAGDSIRSNGRHDYRIDRVVRYPSFQSLINSEEPQRIYPTDPDNLLNVLREICPPEKEALGALAIYLQPTEAVDDRSSR